METEPKRSFAFIVLLMALSCVFACANATEGTVTTDPNDFEQSQWALVWEDDFGGTELDDTHWTRCKRGTPDWKNTMSDDPRLLKIEDGVLHLRGIVNDTRDEDPAPYLTAGVTSQGKFSFQYGKVQIRARFKSAQGAWPALWMLGSEKGWPANGEIDLMEHLNFDDIIYQTVHSEYTIKIDKTNTPKKGGTASIKRDDWNTYGCEWDTDMIAFTVNGKVTHTYPRVPEIGEKQWPFNQPFYFILSMQIGGNWVNGSGPTNAAHYPAGMEVDWVRVYDREKPSLQASNTSMSAGLVKSEFIYETAPFPSCHASTIVETTNGLVAAWFGGTEERDPDVGIWVSRFEGDHWTVPVEVANGVGFKANRLPTWNPVLFQPRTGPLMLFYKVGPSPSTWWGMLRTSADQGKSWSEARSLPEGFLGPIKNKPVQLANGDILCPTSSEEKGWRVHFERTSDNAQNWTKTDALNDGRSIGAIQPSVLFLGGDKLLALGRTRQGRIFQITSDDAGKNWGEMTLTKLPNPSAGTDAVTLKDGRHLLVYNHTSRGRSPLNVAVSLDGFTWQAALELENEPRSEFSYPAIIQTRDGLVHITYTWKRQRIRHAVIDPAKLVVHDMVNGEWPR